MMLHRSKSNRTAVWKYGFSAPLFAGMLIFSAATASTEGSKIAEEAKKIIEPVNSVLQTAAVRTLAENPQLQEETAAAARDTVKEVKRYPMGEVVIASGDKEAVDFDLFKRYLQRNLRYPFLGRQQKTTGAVVARFEVANEKIGSANIEKTPSEHFSREVLRVLKSYTGELGFPDGSYSLSFVFQLAGVEASYVDPIGEDVRNHKGLIVIVGYPYNSVEPLSPKRSARTGAEAQSADSNIKDFATVEVLPEFDGGTTGWANYLKSNLKYPAVARENNLQGRVIVSFVVEKDGSLTDIKVLRGIGGGADEEAVRILKEAPKWRPGIQNGETVRVAYTMPIFFQLSKPAEKTDNDK